MHRRQQVLDTSVERRHKRQGLGMSTSNVSAKGLRHRRWSRVPGTPGRARPPSGEGETHGRVPSRSAQPFGRLGGRARDGSELGLQRAVLGRREPQQDHGQLPGPAEAEAGGRRSRKAAPGSGSGDAHILWSLRGFLNKFTPALPHIISLLTSPPT